MGPPARHAHRNRDGGPLSASRRAEKSASPAAPRRSPRPKEVKPHPHGTEQQGRTLGIAQHLNEPAELGVVARVELGCLGSHRAHARAPEPRGRTGRRGAMPRLCDEYDVVLAWQLPGSGSTYAAARQAHRHQPHRVQGLSGRALEARPGSGIAHPRGAESCSLRARRGRDPRSASGATGNRRLIGDGAAVRRSMVRRKGRNVDRPLSNQSSTRLV